MGHYLSLLLALPACGAAGVLCIPERRASIVKAAARAVAGATVLLALPLWTWYRPTDPEFQLVERFSQVPMLGAGYSVGIDGISLVFVLLAATLGLVATLLPLGTATGRIKGYDKRYYAALLMHEAALLGAFLALDTLLFAVCWLVALFTMWRLISTSGAGSRAATSRFTLWSAVSFVAVLVGVVTMAVLARQVNGAGGFDITALQKLSVSPGLQAWISATFLVGFIAAMSLVPFRGWLPDALCDAPPGAAVMLSGVLVRVGAFGLVRFTLPLVPDAVRTVSPYIAGLAVAGVVLTAILAVRQSDWLRVVGYLSMSQGAMTLLGLMTPMPGAVTGGVVLAVTHGIASAAAIVAVGRVAARLGTRDVAAFRGLRPMLSTATLLAFIVAALSIASPIASGWVGESLIAAGVTAVHSRLWLAPAAFGGLLASGWVAMRGYQVFYAKPRLSSADLKPLAPRLAEAGALSMVTLVALWTGLQPDSIVSRVHLPALKVAARVDSRFEAEFLAACDTTVTPELKAASAANQFLAAAPCGPDGKPLALPPEASSTSVTGAP